MIFPFAVVGAAVFVSIVLIAHARGDSSGYRRGRNDGIDEYRYWMERAEPGVIEAREQIWRENPKHG